MTSIFTGIVIIIVAMVAVIVWRGRQMRQLVEKGVEGTATIEKIWGHTVSTGTKRHRLRYRFLAANGREYGRAIMISPEESDRFQVGENVTVVYLQENPEVSALADAVGQARKALKK